MVQLFLADKPISIHAPRTGSDSWIQTSAASMGTFQSTLPARGATGNAEEMTAASRDFNPRSPHGERHDSLDAAENEGEFQSTLPARGATPSSGTPASP